MCMSSSTCRLIERALFCTAIMTMLAFWVTGADGQETDRRSRGSEEYPRLPGAITKAPEGLGSTPFDINKFFAAVPRAQNAAPLYLDALFEFTGDVQNCFPEGTERDRRRRAVADRMKRYQALDEALNKDPKAVSAAAIDEVVKLYDNGFQKLAEVQRHERCVFETGLGFDALLPHAQASRQVIRVMSLKIRRH